MSECTSLDRRSKAAPGGRIAAAALDVWRGLRRYWRMRATVRKLEALDDRALRDIGLERDHIEDAVRGIVRRRDGP